MHPSDRMKEDGLFFPEFAGVGLSRNPFAWKKSMDEKAGMLRLVFGLGTRAACFFYVTPCATAISIAVKPRTSNTRRQVRRQHAPLGCGHFSLRGTLPCPPLRLLCWMGFPCPEPWRISPRSRLHGFQRVNTGGEY